MKLPRDVSGERLVRALRKFGYVTDKQTGAHIRVQTDLHGVHKQTVPRHGHLKVGTLHEILSDIAAHHGTTIDQLVEEPRI